MLRVPLKSIWMIMTLSTLMTNQIAAYCSRCVKIEEERAKEQIEHPQTFHYYDDQIGLHSNDNKSFKGEPVSSSDSSKNQEKTPQGSIDSSTNLQKSSQNQSNAPDPSIHSSNADLGNSPLLLLAASSLIKNHDPLIGSINSQTNNDQEQEDSSGNNFFEEDEAMKNHLLSTPNENRPDTEKRYLKDENNRFASSQNPTYSTLYTIFKTKFFLETLDGSFTLFIPTNEALERLPKGTLIELTKPENQEQLAALVSNHVVARKILKNDFVTNTNKEIKAISGRNLTMRSENGKLTIDGAQILRIEPAAYDGVIYIINKVLIP
jgi:uncharacterized surface protein with fasciclin (FAS1) repeats